MHHRPNTRGPSMVRIGWGKRTSLGKKNFFKQVPDGNHSYRRLCQKFYEWSHVIVWTELLYKLFISDQWSITDHFSKWLIFMQFCVFTELDKMTVPSSFFCMGIDKPVNIAPWYCLQTFWKKAKVTVTAIQRILCWFLQSNDVHPAHKLQQQHTQQ